MTAKIFVSLKLDAIKLELINWISDLRDKQVIGSILAIKQDQLKEGEKGKKRKFGSGAHLIHSISDAFNDPIDAFDDYKK